MKTLRTRDDLMDLAARYAPTKACGRVLRERGAAILGGFNPVEGLAGWIIRVRSDQGKVWHIGIEADEGKQSYRVVHLDRVPWERWAGRAIGRDPLLDGDDPMDAAYQRMKARVKCDKSPRN